MVRKSKTVRLNLTISEDLEKRFRAEVFKRYGLRKGDIQRAVEEAIEVWLKQGAKQGG
ncbi:MAG: hypothetical protein ACLQEQ_04125 [Nitrososphaerales archaeon]